MGDSSVACALSRLTLHSEPAVFIPLVEAHYAEEITGARVFGSGSGSQACALFTPLTLPYRGELGCYGTFESIEHDQNTEAISVAFSRPGEPLTIEQFTEKCILGDPIWVGEEKVVGRGCFIHAKVYDRFSKPILGGKFAGSLWGEQFASRTHLEAVGCLPVPGESLTTYKHPDIPGVTFYCEGRFVKALRDDNRLEIYGYGLDDLHHGLLREGFPGFPRDAIRKAKSIPSLPAIFRQEAQQIVQTLQLEAELERLTQLPPEPLFGVLFDKIYLRAFRGIEDSLFAHYIFQMAQGKFLDRFEQLFYLLWAFTDANSILMPSICGRQYPEHVNTSIITGFIDAIAKARLRDSRHD